MTRHDGTSRRWLWAPASLLAAALVIGALAGLAPLGVAEEFKPTEKANASGPSPEADAILKKMCTYMEGLRSFSVNADISNEVITTDGQKLQMCSFCTILMSRPNRFKVARKGMYADVEMTFDGQLISILGRRMKVYYQLPLEGSCDDAIRELEFATGMDAPGADLLFSSPYDILSQGIVKGDHIGTDVVNGVECENLAFREAKVDWQIWVQTGDRPLPMKYIITNKWTTGAPQYVLALRDWNTEPVIDEDAFGFKAPEGARKLESLPVNSLGEIEVPEEGR
jgi:hypothetical protein